MPNDQDVKYAIEAFLFAGERPLPPEQIREAFSAEGGSASGGEASVCASRIKASLDELKSEYETQNRGFRLCEIAGGWQLATDDRFAPYLKRFFQNREKRRPPQAALETLSVAA